MRILLTSSASHRPPRGGSTRSNLAWLDMLQAQGHVCRVVGGALPSDTPEHIAQARRELEDQRIDRAWLEMHAVADPVTRAATLANQIREFEPDWVLVSSEDIGQVLLRAAHKAAPGRVIYLAHTPQFYPFGPASWNPSRDGAELVSRSAAIIAIAHHTADYIRRHLGGDAETIHPPIYGRGPFALYGSFDGGAVTMVNPCAVKGISIFAALADRFPALRFAALPGWGTTAEDRQLLAARANVTMLRNCRDIDDVLRDTGVLLVPSLWLEGFGLIVVEAMLRGIPVMASDSGGLAEAKLGTPFVIPVRPIERYEATFDEQGLPRAVVPAQDLEPWIAALTKLSSDPDLYQEQSRAAREAAAQFVAGLRTDRLEEFLTTLKPAAPVTASNDVLAGLSPERRALLLQRLRARQ
ncbi:MAG TPA: glycosyltransferase family 4 protein [Bryobacteraceae bacterium]|nr:glycosyltransferase family 4 protein [Bryobacteraceae bacterium]